VTAHLDADAQVDARPNADAPAEGWPLTEAQAGIWYAQRLDPSNPVFATAQYVDIRGPLHRTAFEDAVHQAMDEADALAIRVIDDPQGPRQIVDPERRARLVIRDLRADTDPIAAAREAMRADLRTPLDPARDPLAAQWLFIIDDDHHLWYQRLHHLVTDGFGTALLSARICDLYSSRVGGGALMTPSLGSLQVLVDADREYRSAARRAKDRDYWLGELADAPEVAGLAPGVALTSHRYARAVLDWPAGAGTALQALAAKADVPWPDVITALVAAYQARHAGGTEATVGVTTMERLGTPAARVPAMVMNILPARVRIDEDRPLAEWVADVSAGLRRSRRHGRYRSEQLRRDLGLLGAERRLYGTLVNVLPFDDPPRLHGVRASLHVLATGPVDDLTVTVRASAGLDRLSVEIDANPNLYRDEEVAAHALRLMAFVERCFAAERLADVPTLTPREQARWVDEVNATARTVEETTLDALVDRAIAGAPHAPALVCGDRILSYADFDAGITQLASALLAHGVKRGDIVAVALHRSVELVLALHAVVRIGAAYLPLDVEQPVERLSKILRSAEPQAVITARALAARLPAHPRVLQVDDVFDAPRDANIGANIGADVEAGAGAVVVRQLVERPRPDDAAYVIYTSGSTGEPKGVVVGHRAIVNRLEWMRTHYQIRPADRVLQKTPATFDVSVWELFLPFLAGATLVVAPPDAHKDPRALAALIAREQVSIAHFVPSMLAVFLSEPDAQLTSMRAVFASGEALSAALRDRFHRVLRADLHNLYGPTEAAVDVSFWPADRDDRSDPVPIGWPVWNTALHVLDDRGRPVPAGVTGHLFIAGVQLARGYLGRPDLTAERFVPDLFGSSGSRMYRTGDLARRRGDGAIEFLGRSDHQVKIRGQRIELGEIEAAFAATGLVARVLVMARDTAPDDTSLVAYVETSAFGAADEATLRRLVAEQLPGVMVPSAIVLVDAWPTTANGKIDRARLSVPSRDAAAGPPAVTANERRVAALFAELLKLDERDVGADADFFVLGGHSLLAAQLVRRVREGWSCDVGLGQVFAQSSVSRLAARLDALTGVAASGPRGPEAADDGLRPIVHLNRVTRRRPAFFCVHPAGGISWCYGQLARALEPERPVYGLQAPGLRAGVPLAATLDELAADYVARVRELQPDGPYHLGGWSVGGILAQAMAVQLEAAGATVGVLAMLDAYPSDRWHAAAEAGEADALRAVLLMAGENPDDAPDDAGVALSRDAVIRRLRAGGHPLGELPDEALAGVLRVVAHHNHLVRLHRHAPCAAGILHFAAALEHAVDGWSAEEWRPYVGAIERYDVPYLHAQMTGPAASRIVAARLSERMP
jgi:enterobactin synthetase component F